jgi:hypothetical protein
MHPMLPRQRLLETVRLPSETHLAAVGAQSGASDRRYTHGIALGKPGRCPEQPVLLITLYDNSASVTGGNDPIGHRFLEAELAIRRVGTRCRCGQELVATLHFDTPTTGDLQPTPITKSHFEDITRSLAIPPDGAGISCLGPSLTAARHLVDRHPSHHPILVVLSDYELFDNFLSDLIAFPGDVHAVVLRAAPPPILISADTVTVTAVDYNSHPGIVARAIFGALTHTRPGAQALPPPSPA